MTSSGKFVRPSETYDENTAVGADGTLADNFVCPPRPFVCPSVTGALVVVTYDENVEVGADEVG